MSRKSQTKASRYDGILPDGRVNSFRCNIRLVEPLITQNNTIMIKIPNIYSLQLQRDLKRLSAQFIAEYIKEVRPVLIALGVSDDASVRKYIHSRTFEDIYRDAIKRNEMRVQFLEDMAKSRDEDFWSAIRDSSSEVQIPKERGFVFKQMPLAEDIYRDKFLKAITVENGILKVNESILREESLLTPAPWMVECYEMVSDFCEKLNAKNFKRKRMQHLFIYDKDGNLKPNMNGIVWGDQPNM